MRFYRGGKSIIHIAYSIELDTLINLAVTANTTSWMKSPDLVI